MGKVTYIAREIVSSRRALTVPQKKFIPRACEGGGRERHRSWVKRGESSNVCRAWPPFLPSPFFCCNPSSVDHRSRKLFFILAYIYRVRGGSLRATQTCMHAHTVCFIYICRFSPCVHGPSLHIHEGGEGKAFFT